MRETSCRQGFTLVEFLMAGAVAVLIAFALVASQRFGDRMWQITQTKISVSDQARQLFRLLAADIHAARSYKVGTASDSNFIPAPGGATQQGNGVQLSPDSGSFDFVRYYFDVQDGCLKRITNGGVPVVLSSGITNGLFSLEDIYGNVLSRKQTDAVIGVTLAFYELSNPTAQVGPSHYYKSYQLSSKFTPCRY